MILTDADKAYQLIKDLIVTTEMRPGSVIRESELMKELELGRTPIREALKRLQSENGHSNPAAGYVRCGYCDHRSHSNL